jgi:hypothetical protein
MDKAMIPQTRPQSAFPLRRFWMRERRAKHIAMIAQMLEHRMPGRKKIFMEQTNRDSATMPSTCDAVAKEAFLAFSCSEIGGSVSGERGGTVSEVGGCGVKSCWCPCLLLLYRHVVPLLYHAFRHIAILKYILLDQVF